MKIEYKGAKTTDNSNPLMKSIQSQQNIFWFSFMENLNVPTLQDDVETLIIFAMTNLSYIFDIPIESANSDIYMIYIYKNKKL